MQPEPDRDLVVATPERVSFDYQVAGLGTRTIAQVLDLLIVFLFRHPIMTMLARTPAFLSPRVSGLGRVLRHAREDAPAPGKTRAKEA